MLHILHVFIYIHTKQSVFTQSYCRMCSLIDEFSLLPGVPCVFYGLLISTMQN